MHSLKKENKEFMAQVNLHETKLIHVSESHTSQLYQNANVNQDMTEGYEGPSNDFFKNFTSLTLQRKNLRNLDNKAKISIVKTEYYNKK